MRTLLGAALLAGAFYAAPLAAQQRQADLHFNYARATQTKTNSWGAGANYQLTWGGSSAPVKLGTSLGLDYTKQEKSGPSQTNVSLDGTLQPGGNSSVTPYVGGSVGENWSGGSAKQWTGAKLGLEAIAGAQIKLSTGGGPSVKAEERFGYIKGQDHSLTTRVGVVFGF